MPVELLYYVNIKQFHNFTLNEVILVEMHYETMYEKQDYFLCNFYRFPSNEWELDAFTAAMHKRKNVNTNKIKFSFEGDS